jgi:hypothetical protein
MWKWVGGGGLPIQQMWSQSALFVAKFGNFAMGIRGNFFTGKLACAYVVDRPSNRKWSRIARWYFCIPKIPICVYFGGPWNRQCLYTFWPFAIFTTIWYTLHHIATFQGDLVYFSRFGMLCQEKSGNHEVKNCILRRF